MFTSLMKKKSSPGHVAFVGLMASDAIVGFALGNLQRQSQPTLVTSCPRVASIAI